MAEVEGLGNVDITPSAYMELSPDQLYAILQRHIDQDYGDVEFERKWDNDVAFFKKQGYVYSRYRLPSGVYIAVLTQWNVPLTHIMVDGEVPLP
jgi:hypothetical protein